MYYVPGQYRNDAFAVIIVVNVYQKTDSQIKKNARKWEEIEEKWNNIKISFYQSIDKSRKSQLRLMETYV